MRGVLLWHSHGHVSALNLVAVECLDRFPFVVAEPPWLRDSAGGPKKKAKVVQDIASAEHLARLSFAELEAFCKANPGAPIAYLMWMASKCVFRLISCGGS